MRFRGLILTRLTCAGLRPAGSAAGTSAKRDPADAAELRVVKREPVTVTANYRCTALFAHCLVVRGSRRGHREQDHEEPRNGPDDRNCDPSPQSDLRHPHPVARRAAFFDGIHLQPTYDGRGNSCEGSAADKTQGDEADREHSSLTCSAGRLRRRPRLPASALRRVPLPVLFRRRIPGVLGSSGRIA